MKFVAICLIYAIKIRRRAWMFIQLPLFKKRGKNITVGHDCDFSYQHIELGNDVFIGAHARFLAEKSIIRIGSKVMFGPGVTILGGDHRTNIPGVFMFDIKEKLPENDRDVVIEDDIWIGANALILKGVTIGRGSIVGAGSVVVKSIPPYSIYVGNPIMKIRPRWDMDMIIMHEQLVNEALN